MKSKTSCFSKTIFRKNITHFWPIWCLFLLFYLFIMPFSEFIGYLGEKAGYDTVIPLVFTDPDPQVDVSSLQMRHVTHGENI